jgi:vesicle-fusing ATPase
MNIRQNLFGQSPKPGGRAAGGYDRPPATPPRDDTPMAGGYDDRQPPRQSYGAPMPPARQAMPQRTAVGRVPPQPMSPARRVQLRIAKVEDKTLQSQYIFGNL